MGSSDNIENQADQTEVLASEPTPEVQDDPEAAAERLDEQQDLSDQSFEDPRIHATAEDLRKIEWLREEKWQHLDEFQRRAALNEAGRALGRRFGYPAAPLITEKMPEDNESIQLGETPPDGYEIDVNERLVKENLTAQEALKTYCHEYRHTWQMEQVAEARFAGNMSSLREDAEQVAEWYDNMEVKGYTDWRDNPDEYARQSVERDSRRFADGVVSRVYGEGKGEGAK